MLVSIFESLRLLVQEIIILLDYPGIALVMVAVAPELVMPFAGFLVAENRLSFAGVLVAGTLGALISAVIIYSLALLLGEPRVRAFLRRYGRCLLLYERDLDRALRLFARYDDIVVLFARFIPTVRSLISLPAGLLSMPLARFLLFTALGTIIWNTALTYAGVILGRNWRQVLAFLEIYESLIWTALALLLLVFLARRLRRFLVPT